MNPNETIPPTPLPSLAVCPDLVDKYLEETSIRYVTPRAHSTAEHSLGHPHKSGEDLGLGNALGSVSEFPCFPDNGAEAGM